MTHSEEKGFVISLCEENTISRSTDAYLCLLLGTVNEQYHHGNHDYPFSQVILHGPSTSTRKKIKILIFYSLQRNEDFVHFLSCIQFLYKRTFLSDEQIYYHILHVTATTVNHPEFESGAHAFYPSSLFWEGEFRWREESFSHPPFSQHPFHFHCYSLTKL